MASVWEVLLRLCRKDKPWVPWVSWAVGAVGRACCSSGGRLFLPVNSGFSARCWDINEKAFEGVLGVAGRKVPEGEAIPLFWAGKEAWR